MEYSDDKINKDERETTVETENKSSVEADADGIVMPSAAQAQESVVSSKNKTDAERNVDNGGNGSSNSAFAGELVSISVKAVAVVLSLVIMITCILAVAMPLSAMRIFNKLGMSARAVDFGERYIARELNSYGGTYEYTDSDGSLATGKGTAAHTDAKGNYDILKNTRALTNDDFLEALYVCTNLSYNLMDEYYGDGNDASGAYYAERVEKYTRMYLSLYDVSAVNAQKSASNIASMPSLALRPYVYSYGHDIRVMNFRARVYLNSMENVMSASVGGVDELLTLSNTFGGLTIPEYDASSETRSRFTTIIDNYVDYISYIGEYLDVEFLRAGVENDLSKKGSVKDGEIEYKNIDVVSEPFVHINYGNKLSGDEFGLLLTKTDGFTSYYENMKRRLTEYFQAAIDFTPIGDNKLDEQLHQLYWLQAMSSVARKLWYWGMLLYYNCEKFGMSRSIVYDEYADGVFSGYTFIEYGGRLRQIWEVYDIKLAEYMAQYQI